MSIMETIGRLKELAAQRADLRGKLMANLEESKRGRQEFIALIDAGETTGDPLRDLMEVRSIEPDSERGVKLQNLQNSLAGKTGQLVLAIVTREEFRGCGGLGYEPGNTDYDLTIEIYLGELSDDRLVIDAKHSKCSLPTKKYVHCSESGREALLTATEGNLSPDIAFPDRLDEAMVLKNPRTSSFWKKPRLYLEVIVGDDAVRDWFIPPPREMNPEERLLVEFFPQHSHTEMYQEMMAGIDRLVLQP